MNDLISRQSAIDALFGITPVRNTIPLASAIFNIQNLPSAQPEVIRCKDCKWWDKYGEKRGYCMAAQHGFHSRHWEISIYRTYHEDFFCSDAEPKEKEGGDDD